MKKQLLTLLFISLIITSKIVAQSAWTTYNKSNSGIASNNITRIAFDSQGNKWVGTDAGLSKFDGTSWVTYNTTNSGISNNNINQIVIDSQGNKWIVTAAGLCKFDGVNWVTYNTSNSGIASNIITSQIIIDSQGNKWIGTDAGLCKFDGVNWVKYNTSNSGITTGLIYSLTIDNQGNKWLCSYDNSYNGYGLCKFDGVNWVTYNTSNSGIPSNNIYCISIDSQGNKWIGTDAGLCKFDGTNWVTYNTSNSGIPSDGIWTFVIDSQGNKWLPTCGGLCKFDGANWIMYDTPNFNNKDGCYRFIQIVIDSQDNKWIVGKKYDKQYNSLFEIGLFKFDGINFTNYNMNNSGIASDKIIQIVIDFQGNKWIGTDAGLSKLSGNGNSNLCSNKNEIIITKYNKLCVNSTVTLSSKLQSNNYIYVWQGKGISNSNQNQINVTKGGVYSLHIEDMYCYLDTFSISVQIPEDSIKSINYPPYASVASKLMVNCSNSSGIFYNPYPKSYYVNWFGYSNFGSPNFLSSNKDSIILKTSNSPNIILRVYDSICKLKYIDNVIYTNVHDTILNPPTICMLTNQNGYNMVVWENTTNDFIDKYRIYKQNQQTSNYDLVHEQSKHKLSQWVDSLSQPNTRTERYKISILDSCGRETPLSNNHTTILLSSNVGLNGTVNLAWNAYEGFTYPNFEIWRSTDGLNFNLLSTVANNTFAYIDNNPPTTAWYQIRVIKQGGCIPSVKSYTSVNSNIISKEGFALGIKTISENKFSIYPNPTNDILFIDNGNYQAMSGYSIKIVSLTGTVVYNQPITSQQVQISMNQFAVKGLYFAQIFDPNNQLVEAKKIVLE